MVDEKLIEVLEEGVSLEEIPTLTNLMELKVFLKGTDMEEEVKEKLLKKIRKIQSDSIRHSSVFNQLLDKVKDDE